MPKVGKQRAIQPLCQQRKYGERTMSTLEEITIEQSDRVLCVAAHPDDLEYGVSAAVAKWVEQGVDVTYLLLTTGEAGIQDKSPEETGPLRAQEQKRACAKVGVDDLRILDFSDGVLEYSIELRKKIAEVIRDVKPTVLVLTEWGLEVPWGLNHADHRVAGLAAVDAVRDAGNKWLFTDLTDENGVQLDYCKFPRCWSRDLIGRPIRSRSPARPSRKALSRCASIASTWRTWVIIPIPVTFSVA